MSTEKPAMQTELANSDVLKEAPENADTCQQQALHESAEGCTGTTAVRDTLPDDELLYDLADLFKTFADTTRIKLLYALMNRELCVADLAEAVGASQSAVSHQLRILKQARLVRFHRVGKNVIYTLSDDHVNTVLSQGMDHICE